MDGPLDTADVRAFAGDGFVIKRGWFDADEMELLGIVRPMIYVYSTANGAGRIMGYEPLEEPWPGLFLVAVFDDDQEEEAGHPSLAPPQGQGGLCGGQHPVLVEGPGLILLSQEPDGRG